MKVDDSSTGYESLLEFSDEEVGDTNAEETGEKEAEDLPESLLLDPRELCAGREKEAEELPELGTEKVVPKRVVREWTQYVKEKVESIIAFIEFVTLGDSVRLTPKDLEERYGLRPEDVDEVFGEGYAEELCKEYEPWDGTGDLPEIIPKVPVARKPVARRKTVDMEVWQRRMKILAEAKRKEAERRRQEEEEKRRMREAEEFVRMFPDVWFKNIPRGVFERRAQGGVTLAQAYKLHVGNKVSSLPTAKLEERKVAIEELSENVDIMSECCRLHGFSLKPGSLFAERCLSATKEELLAELIEALETKSRERPKHR